MSENASPPSLTASGRAPADDFVVIASGLVTTVLVALVLAFVLVSWNWAVYSWRAFWYFPFGALFCGYVAASGYYFAAKFRGGRLPSSLWIWIGLASVAAYFLVHALAYLALADAGKLARSHMSFGRYLDVMNDTPQLDIRHAPAMLSGSYRPGRFSFVWGVVEILLFAGAGWSLFGPRETTDRKCPDREAS